MAQIIGKGCPPLPPLSCAWGFARPGGKSDIYIFLIYIYSTFVIFTTTTATITLLQLLYCYLSSLSRNLDAALRNQARASIRKSSRSS